MIRLLLDCDGIFRNFIHGALSHINPRLGTNHQHDDVTEWDVAAALGIPKHIRDAAYAELTKEGGCRSLPTYTGAILAYEQLAKIADCYWVTSPMSAPHWTFETERWLERHFGVDHHKVVHTSAKHIVSGHVLLEDKVENLQRWCAHNPDGFGILWSCPGNRRAQWDGLRAESWASLIQFVTEINRLVDSAKLCRWSTEPLVR